jgi:hypothetical protein
VEIEGKGIRFFKTASEDGHTRSEKAAQLFELITHGACIYSSRGKPHDYLPREFPRENDFTESAPLAECVRPPLRPAAHRCPTKHLTNAASQNRR